MALCGERGFVDVIKLGLLRWGDVPGSRRLSPLRREAGESERDAMLPALNGGTGHEPRKGRGLWKLGRQGDRPHSRASGRNPALLTPWF